MGDFEYLKEDEDATGVGADIFVRKKKPGPAVGVGYYVDIYESGVKINSVEARTKKDVKQILDEYKSKYNTLRSFEIESQQHITYKTKEERGEEPPKKPEEEKKPETEVTTERGETAMNTIDQVLLKKASIIETMLTRLKYPTLPIKKWAETAVGQGNVDLFPETPPEAGVTDETVVDEKTTANKIVKKLIEYVQNNAQKPVDELYNGIKHWISIVKKKMKEWEKMSGQPLDRKMIAEQIKNAVTSGDAAVIKQVSGLDVTPEVAAALQKVTLMEIGSAQDSGVLAESIGKAASLDDDVAKVVGIVSKAPESEAKFEAAQALKETFGDSIPDIVQMLPETFHGKAVEKAIMEMEQDAANKSDSISTTAVNPTSMNPTVEISIKAFWNYAYRAKKTASLEVLFEEWVNKNSISFDCAESTWKSIKKAIDLSFFNRIAQIIPEKEFEAIFNKFLNSAYAFLRDPATKKDKDYVAQVDNYVLTCNEYLDAVDIYLRTSPKFVDNKSVAERATQVMGMEEAILRYVRENLNGKFGQSGTKLYSYIASKKFEEIVQNWVNTKNSVSAEPTTVAPVQSIQPVQPVQQKNIESTEV